MSGVEANSTGNFVNSSLGQRDTSCSVQLYYILLLLCRQQPLTLIINAGEQEGLTAARLSYCHGLLPAPWCLLSLHKSRRWSAVLASPLCGLMAPGRHSSDQHFRGCGVGYYTDTQERVWATVWPPLPGLKLLAVVRTIEECLRDPHGVAVACTVGSIGG
eukprot:3809681-Amphidinium_carterae.1